MMLTMLNFGTEALQSKRIGSSSIQSLNLDNPLLILLYQFHCVNKKKIYLKCTKMLWVAVICTACNYALTITLSRLGGVVEQNRAIHIALCFSTTTHQNICFEKGNLTQYFRHLKTTFIHITYTAITSHQYH